MGRVGREGRGGEEGRARGRGKGWEGNGVCWGYRGVDKSGEKLWGSEVCFCLPVAVCVRIKGSHELLATPVVSHFILSNKLTGLEKWRHLPKVTQLGIQSRPA